MTADESLARSPDGRELGYLALQAGRLVQAAVESVATQTGMPASDLLALYVLGEHGGLTGSALARMLSLQQSSITPLADRLEAAGLIERSRDDTDRRRVWLRTTARGEKVRGEATAGARDAVRDAFSPLSRGSATALAALLGEIVEPWLAEITGPAGRTEPTRDDPARSASPGRPDESW